MRILQLSYELPPKRMAASGGDLGMFQNLSALLALGHEVHLAIVGTRDHQVEPEVRQRVASLSELRRRDVPWALRPLERVLNPETFNLRFPDAHGLTTAVNDLARQLRPDVIWADSIFALSFAPRRTVPVVWGNYDFLFKLKTVRKETAQRFEWKTLRDPASLRRRIHRPDAMSLATLEKLELGLAREAAHVMCVSASESEFLEKRGIASTHIPIVGPTIAPPAATAETSPRLFLFGNHNTAHAAALAEIRQRLWPGLANAAAWHQVGRPPKQPDDDWRWMERNFHKCHGFVEDLSEVMRIGDISVVPYRHDTGFRTKFTVAAGYGVISAGYAETFLCAPEFRPGIDCIAERGPDEFVPSLRRALEEHPSRIAMGHAARRLYDESYTFEAQLPRYAQILESARRGR